MGLLDWMSKGQKVSPESSRGHQEPAIAGKRFKQPGDPFKKGDRVVVYEVWNVGPEFRPEPCYSPGIVSSVYHNGTLVSYEGGGRLPANAAVEDVRHATESDCAKYTKEFAAIEAKIERQQAPVNATESGRSTLPRPKPSWER